MGFGSGVAAELRFVYRRGEGGRREPIIKAAAGHTANKNSAGTTTLL